MSRSAMNVIDVIDVMCAGLVYLSKSSKSMTCTAASIVKHLSSLTHSHRRDNMLLVPL